MVLGEVAEGMPGFRYQILGTDISVNVLETARRGVYPEDRIAPVPTNLRKKYLLRSRDRGLVRIVGDLRATVSFWRLNFMDGEFGLREKRDVTFFRNVMIYFDRPTQEVLLNRFCRHLAPGGYLFLGHSETINGLHVPLFQVKPTVYQYRG
jgi:chemotaxis protein methyltransferase CheR